MGGKRMSQDEKRKVILGIYHDTKQVYTEKEILALATKAGVNAGTVGDVHKALVDEGEVEKEKIGGSNYFWSFPGKKDRMSQLEHESIKKEIQKLEEEKTQAETALADAKRGREDDGEDGGRAKKLARLSELAKEKVALEAELATLKENDPQSLADLQKELQLVTQGANRWTDNIYNCQSYLVKKRSMDKKQVNKLLGISDDFDYPEDKIPA